MKDKLYPNHKEKDECNCDDPQLKALVIMNATATFFMFLGLVYLFQRK